jgi:hypothetical protein
MSKFGIVTAALAAATLAITAHSQSAAPYSWNTIVPHRAAQFGVPETDDRSLRVDCKPPGTLSITGPTPSDREDGARISVQFAAPGFHEIRSATVSHGDVTQFTATVEGRDKAIQTLLAGRALSISTAGSSWTVSGEGAGAVLRPILAACSRGADRRH